MPVIYEPRGRAQEYSDLACNLYSGCGHRCVYCYAPLATRTSRQAFGLPEPRKDVLKKLATEIHGASLFAEKRSVLLSFTSDAYQPIEQDLGITREAIKLLHQGGYPVTILSKGGRRSMKDFDLLTDKDSYAATLTLLDDDLSRQWEPGAALPQERIEALNTAHGLGIVTWVSLEPVLDPDAVYAIIEQTHEFVDLYKVGMLNYHPHARTIDWPEFASQVVELLKNLGCKYYLKEDLRKCLGLEKQLCKSV